MTLEQIDYFICAAQSRTFFDAAEAMHISQSSLSKQIMKLEQELGVMLWDRSRRKAGLLCLLLKESFFTKKHLRFPDSIIVLWKQCTILRTVSSRHFILEHFLFFLSTILLL